MKTKEEYLSALRVFRQQYGAQYGIRTIGIFGSVARDEQHADSDLDVFVELEEKDLFVLFDIRDAIQACCHCPVDLIRLRKDLRTVLLKQIEKEGIYA
jgi:predicted nucleotidyltransferase